MKRKRELSINIYIYINEGMYVCVNVCMYMYISMNRGDPVIIKSSKSVYLYIYLSTMNEVIFKAIGTARHIQSSHTNGLGLVK